MLNGVIALLNLKTFRLNCCSLEFWTIAYRL